MEEQRRKIKSIIKALSFYLNADEVTTDQIDEAENLLINEDFLLLTFGFNLIPVEHPHKHIENFFKLVETPGDLTQISYLLASNM